MNKITILIIALLAISCSSRNQIKPLSDAERFHLGTHTFEISSDKPEAKAAFNRGLTLAYAFSYAAAEREFRKAAELDPKAAMPWWGVALVNGPHINFPLVPPENAKIAWDAISRAKKLTAVSDLEKDLITALSKRYVKNQPADRSKLDTAYSKAMAALSIKYKGNADVTTLYAESLMDLHPWDLWDIKGAPKPWAPEIIITLERAMSENPNHPGANHLYVHAVEGSNSPELGIAAADRLRTLVPGAGHLVHMPAHIYIRVGRLEDSALANEAAIKADDYFRKSNPRPGFYAMYMAHNHHFLSFSRMMQGQEKKALAAARAMMAGIPEEFFEKFGPIADGYMAITVEVLMRFGRWEEILKEPEPASSMPIARAIWRFARAASYTALDRQVEAEKERVNFLTAVKQVPKDATFGNNEAKKLLAIAEHVLDGEMAAKKKDFPLAIKKLSDAVSLEDSLKYDEPPDWILPVRHTLGATYLRAGKYAHAEKVYREDLKKFPDNGWSLFGLSRALKEQGKNDEAKLTWEKYKNAWKDSDTVINSSCLCQPLPELNLPVSNLPE